MDGSDWGNGRVAGTDKRVLRLPAVMERTGLSKTSIYRLIQADEFPAAVRLGPRAVGWPAQRIDEWIDSRESAADGTAGRRLRRR